MTIFSIDWRYGLFLVLVFCLPVLLGDAGTVLILAGATLFGLVLFPQRARVRTPAAALFLAVFALMAIAFIGSARTLWDARFAFNFLPVLLAIVIAAIPANRDSRADLTDIAILAALGSALSLAVAATQIYILGETRAGGHVINAIHFANIAVMLGFLSLIGIFSSANPWRYLLLIAPALAIASCILSASRGPLLGGGVLLAVFLCVLWFRSRRAVIGTLLAVGAIALAVFALAALYAPVQLARFASVFDIVADALLSGDTADGSTNIRLGFYEAGWRAFLEAPLFGHGWERIISASYPYMEPWLQGYVREQSFTYLHNDVLDFAAGAGLLGLFAYGILLTTPVIAVLAGPRDRRFLARLYGALVLSVGFLVFGLTSRLMGHALQLTLFSMMTMVILCYGSAAEKEDTHV